MAGGIAVVAGRGELPVKLCRRLLSDGRQVVLASMEGFEPDNPLDVPVVDFRVERLGKLFHDLRAHDVGEIVFAGAIQRPKFDLMKLDFKTIRLAPRILPGIRNGDDGTLRMVISIFESEGFTVHAAHEIAPELLLAGGVHTKAQPTDHDRKDAARAAQIVHLLSAADVGQGAVVAQGIALAVEAVPGTDAMLAYVADVAGGFRPRENGARGVLFKGPKDGQDCRVDLPAIGPATIDGAARAGLAGVVIEEGGVMVLQPDQTIAACDRHGLFLWVRPAGEGNA
ncbi:LpxI family protein [Qingshengfaniella alkalisoli]|uniref:LpxI family protein n=1 Tax=Qingshengfaniella alkalisoli TaxID=2599296 RepID=A0A5B8IXJ8_9RHOB|nr:UDP-2,3-diacylglucosamine diphosphatase LpxI [Qingshengfaniella alkalisoli]QDY69328.1 LpxI family protein [Qingshengfaniella alkalisoli]